MNKKITEFRKNNFETLSKEYVKEVKNFIAVKNIGRIETFDDFIKEVYLKHIENA